MSAESPSVATEPRDHPAREPVIDTDVHEMLVSSRDPADLGRRAQKSGAVGFISKDRLSEETLRELVGDGE